jgi:hypothetical protein
MDESQLHDVLKLIYAEDRYRERTWRKNSTLKVDTLRKRKETFDWINELTMTLIRVLAVHTQYRAETARRLAVENWLQRNGVITITQNKKVLPVFLEQFAHN